MSANIDARSTAQKGDETQIKGIPRQLDAFWAIKIVFQRNCMT